MADEACAYTDPDTGLTYEICYDQYVDPDRFIVRTAWLNDKRIRITPELRKKFVRAAYISTVAEHRARFNNAGTPLADLVRQASPG
jgi:hypothetical protein